MDSYGLSKFLNEKTALSFQRRSGNVIEPHEYDHFPGVPVSRPLGEHEPLFSIRKFREILGQVEEHNWTK